MLSPDIFPILLIPLGILSIWIFIINKDVSKIMKRENSNYTGRVNNTIDLFRIISTFRKSKTLSVKDRKLFLKLFILMAVSSPISIVLLVNFLYRVINN